MQLVGAGFQGTFVISWAQTKLDSFHGTPFEALRIGASWQWDGAPLRLDGPAGILRLHGAEAVDALHQRAARKAQRLTGAVPEPEGEALLPPLQDRAFVVTDGGQNYRVTLVDLGAGKPPLLTFPGAIPPRGRELWVVSLSLAPAQRHADQGGVICFTPGTRITTPDGLRLIEDLAVGDAVLTKDNGAQRIEWIGARRMSGARLYAMPELRPVRISAGVLGADRPDEALLVSPAHRMVVKSDAARDLFSAPEVLVAARDLVDDVRVRVDLSLREVTYVHLLLPRHEVIWANGAETESFHPAGASLLSLSEVDRAALLDMHPALEDDPHCYGVFARRLLTQPEAAILRHAA